MPNYTLDITGFYYQIIVDIPENPSILDIMNAARGVRTENGGVMDFDADGDGFITRISVDYDNQSNPESRQLGGLPSRVRIRERGRYEFVDDVSSGGKIEPADSVPGVLTWQYYVFDTNNTLQNNDRFIKSAGTSNQGNNPVLIPPDGKVVWRLVGIFGANPVLEAANMIAGATNFKSAIRTAVPEADIIQQMR